MKLAILAATCLAGYWLLTLARSRRPASRFVSEEWIRQQTRRRGVRGWTGANSSDYEP